MAPSAADAPHEAVLTRALRRSPRSGGALVKVLLAVAALIGLLVASVALGMGSAGAGEVQEGILALEKNRPLREALLPAQVTPAGDPVLAAALPATVGAFHFGGDGVCADLGAEGAPPLVFVHGTPDTMGAWAPVLFGEGALAGKTNIVTLEVVGHGMLGDAEGPFPFQRCAEHVIASLETLGLSGVTLVGNSYGGEFCWRAALDRPDLISKLVLIDCSGLPRTDDQFLPEEVKMREWSVARLGYLLNSEERVAFALDPHFEGNADDERVREVFLGLENRTNWGAMIDLVRDENGERADELVNLSMPTLLIFGEHDQAYAPETFGREFERLIPDARLEVIAGAGHYPHEQRPAEVAGLILDFHRRGHPEAAEAGTRPEAR